MTMIAHNLELIHKQIIDAAKASKRSIDEICLIAVSKFQTIDAIKEAVVAGQRHFGENYCQEALIKIEALPKEELIWHFIGQIQRNKTQAIAQHFHWVHTVDSRLIAQRLNRQRPIALPPLNICIQINIDEEVNKAGIAPQEEALLTLAEEIQQLPALKLRGIMIIPQETSNTEKIQQAFQQAQRLFSILQQHYPEIDTLSMGMSADFKLAIQHGATMLRIGTAIFGKRERKTC